MENKALLLSQIGLYNSQRLSDETVESLFIARKKFFDFILEKIVGEKINSIPQHYLIIAQRGMGKSTFLKRIEVELRKSFYNKKFIPLLFPEEQYNLKNLAEFWLNTLDALADTLEHEKKLETVELIDAKVKELDKIKNTEELAREAYTFFKETTKALKRRPVLLVDNMSFIFDRMGKEEQHTLRAWLMQNNAPIVVGASAVAIEDTYDYGAPFYDAFQIHNLKKLTFDELLDILYNLAKLTHTEEIIPDIKEQIARLKTIHQLTGGNPRTAVMLFKIIMKGFSKDINDDLEALLDEITPLYKARFEELPTQLQIIVDAIALHWDPMNLEQMREETGYENNQLSPQIKRLIEMGWVEKIDAYQTKGNAYQVSERFFNIWFLMRRSSRRQKRELYCLSKFLEIFYGDDLQGIAHNSLQMASKSCNHATYNLALAEAIKDETLQVRLKEKSFNEIREFSKHDPELLKQFDIPSVKESVANLFYQYDKLVDNNEYEKAEEVLLQLLEFDKNNDYFQSIVYNNLGGLYHYFMDKYDDAEKMYLSAINLDSEDYMSYNSLGNLYQDHQERYNEAEKMYLKAIEIDENYVYAYNGLGNLYQNHFEKYSKAEKNYLKAIELDENFETTYYNIGNLYQNYLERYDEAEKMYLKAIKLNSKNGQFFYGLGNLYQYCLNRYKDAEKMYFKMIKIDKKDANAYLGLGNLYQLNLNEYADAEKNYLKALKINKHNSLTYYGLANLYHLHLNRPYEAEKMYLKVIKLENDFPDIYYSLGVLYHTNLMKYEKAKEMYLKAIEVDSSYTNAINELANLYQNNLKDYISAESMYLKAIELDEKYDDAYIGLGDLYKNHLNMPKKAEKMYLKAIELGSNTHVTLGNLYQDYLQEYEKAEQYYLKAIESNQDSLFAKYNIVFLYRDKMNKFKEAEELFDSITIIKDLEDSYWLNKALFELYKRNESIAKDYFLKALSSLNGSFKNTTEDDWWRFAAICNNLGFTNWLLSVMEKTGFDIVLSPYFIAIKALGERDAEGFLNSKAVEIREPARRIIEIIKKFK